MNHVFGGVIYLKTILFSSTQSPENDKKQNRTQSKQTTSNIGKNSLQINSEIYDYTD